MNHKLLFVALFSIVLWGSGCAPAAESQAPTTMTVFAAASLTESFTAMAAEFEASRPDVSVILNFAGSQTLRLQVENGAQADLFVSANPEHMQALVEAGLAHEPVYFTQNQLVVITPAANPASIESLADLAQPGLKLVLAGASVPVGRYARQMLANLNQQPEFGPDYAGQVLANLVSEEENVKSVVAKVRLGEADAGIIYASDVTPAVSQELTLIEVPQEFNVIARYPASVLTGSANPALARQFIDFVLSPRGQTLLADHGFRPTQLQAIGSEP